MRNKDQELRSEILKKRGLYDGYAKDMENLHISNAKELNKIIDEYGWSGKSLVGKEGANAAFVIAQNSISKPDLSNSR